MSDRARLHLGECGNPPQAVPPPNQWLKRTEVGASRRLLEGKRRATLPRRSATLFVVAALLAVILTGAHAADLDGHVPDRPEAGSALTHPAVSAQGLFTSSPGHAVSPLGSYQMDYTLAAASENRLRAEIVVRAESPGAQGRWQLHGIPGPALFMSDRGRIVSIESFDPPEIPATLRVYDLEGRELHSERLRVATDPCLSPDGARLVCRTADGVVSLDLLTFEKMTYPLYALFTPGPRELLAGMVPDGPLEVHDPTSNPMAIPIAGDPIRLAWAGDGASVLVLESHQLLRIYPRTSAAEVLFAASPGEEMRDLRVRPGGAIDLAMRRISADRSTGWLVTLAPDGRVLYRGEAQSLTLPRAEFCRRSTGSPAEGGAGRPAQSIPWPILPNSQHPVGNTYNEYQYYGGDPYPHPGVDVLGSPGQHVFAVHAGVVKAVLTTGGDYYWRIAIADTLGSGILPGYLYAHLVESSIPVTVGQQIQAGQYLGDLVDWPVPNFTHTHFARIQDVGAQWHGSWLSIGNPHIHLENQSDDLPPAFEPALGSALLAFCANETSSYQNPLSLHGAVDIIAHVGDRIASTYVCTVQELRYTIYPLGHPDVPVVDNKLAVFFDMANDFYAGGSGYALLTDILYKQDGTCPTQGDYDFREFYHILTNSDGNQQWGPEDLLQSWDTSTLSDGQYLIRVVARDVAGNATSDSMIVRTANGNPSSIEPGPMDAILLQSRPNPAVGLAAISFSLSRPGRVSLGIYDLAGRRVRSLLDTDLPLGRHEVIWDGRGDPGDRIPGGIYFYRLSGPDSARTGRLTLSR